MHTSAYYGFWHYWGLRHKVTFDGPNRLILINYGETSVNIEQDIYSDWKEWSRLEDYIKYPKALSAIGGEPLGGGQFIGATFFLENGWRVRPWEGDAVLAFEGNLYTREEGQSPYVATVGRWNSFIQSTVSTLVFKVESTAGSSSVTINPYEIAQAVWNYSTTASIDTEAFGEHLFTKVLTFGQYLATK